MSAVLFHDVYAMVHQPRLVKRIYFMYRRHTYTMMRKATDPYATPRAVRAYKRPGITKYALDTILIDALNESLIVPHLGNRTGYTYAQLANLPLQSKFQYRINANKARQAVTGSPPLPGDGSADDDDESGWFLWSAQTRFGKAGQRRPGFWAIQTANPTPGLWFPNPT
jgi:hypothetical protein